MTATAHEAAFKIAYRSYLGSLADELSARHGMNTSTHVARVCMDPLQPNKPERSVVKCFHYSDPKWVNEWLCWNLAQHSGVTTTPRAALLVAEKSDITHEHGPEINEFVRFVDTPIVLWCTSAIEPTSPVQQVLGQKWELACLRTEGGRNLGALDGWIGNCDRIPDNAPYWSSGNGGVVAIDFEKMAFGQDWSAAPLEHQDEMRDTSGQRMHTTRLINAIKLAHKSKEKATKTAAGKSVSHMYSKSIKVHPAALSKCGPQIEKMAVKNFGSTASANLLSFLDYRVSEDCIKSRYDMLL